MYTLYLPNGKEMTFYIKDCAEIFQQVFGGTLINNTQFKITVGGSKWRHDFFNRELMLQQRMDEKELW